MRISSIVNTHICSKLNTAGISTTELDSHANMPVFGYNCYVFDSIHGKTCTVEPFDRSIGVATEVPIVDVAIAYHCESSLKTFLLIARNALYMKTLQNNLIPPFIMREAGVIVNDTPRIHQESPSNNDHCLIFKDSMVKIPLMLNGIFSFFESRKPTLEEIRVCDRMFITPDSYQWDPYSEHYSTNEQALVDSDAMIIDENVGNYTVEVPTE